MQCMKHGLSMRSATSWKCKHSGWCCLVCAELSELAVLQVVAWYDNEWGYSQRVVDLAEITAKNWE